MSIRDDLLIDSTSLESHSSQKGVHLGEISNIEEMAIMPALERHRSTQGYRQKAVFLKVHFTPLLVTSFLGKFKGKNSTIPLERFLFLYFLHFVSFFQDWEFPSFQGNLDVKLPGVDTASFYFRLPRFCKKENWQVHITGKWFNYGIIMLVIILDLNMWKNQIFYDPFTFGQYTDSEGYIFSVFDLNFLSTANQSMLSYEWRSQNINPVTNLSFTETDPRMNSKYLDFPLSVKGIAFIPSIVAFLTFGGLIWRYGREEFVVEKVVEDVDKIDDVDGCIIEDIEVHENPNQVCPSQKDGSASADSNHEEGSHRSELPIDNEEGTPVLKKTHHVSYV